MFPRATWSVAETNDSIVDEISRNAGVSPIVASCLANRGLTDLNSIREFLEPRLGMLTLPDNMADLDVAARRTVDAIRRGEKIGVFGDYDVDGVTSAALVASFFRDINIYTETMIADRFGGGYGLSAGVVDRMIEVGCTLLIVLDCGTSDHEAVDRASKAGIDVIIVDHHGVEGAHPKAVAFVNPQRKDCQFPDKTMAAVGLAFYYVAAVRTLLVEEGDISKSHADPRQLLDLVALGTVADVAKLTGNNRIFVSHGLKILSSCKRGGLSALMKISKIRTRRMRTDHISYQLAPRLNAAGRLASARDSYELLMSTEHKESVRLAERLEQLTLERRQVEERVSKQARRQVSEERLAEQPAIVVAGDGWHRGVIGIVAARLSEEFDKPTYVIGFDGDVGTGSARAPGKQVHLHHSLLAASDSLVRFGGHRDAAGFMVEREKLKTLREQIGEYVARESTQDNDSQHIACDGRLNPSQLTSDLLLELERIGPFGNGNPEPIFEVAGLNVLSGRVVGVNHLKLELKTPSGTVAAFGPRMGEYADGIPPMIRVAAAITVDEWRGENVPELRLVKPPVSDE